MWPWRRACALRNHAAEAWQLATSETELPNAIVGGFYHPAQHALTESFAQRYFGTIAEIWVQRPGKIALRLVAEGREDVQRALRARQRDASVPPEPQAKRTSTLPKVTTSRPTA